MSAGDVFLVRVDFLKRSIKSRSRDSAGDEIRCVLLGESLVSAVWGFR